MEESTELDYEKQAFVELLSEDGIAIFAKGLGLGRLFLKFLKLYSDPHSLVLAINTSSTQEQYLIDCLRDQDVKQLPKVVKNEVTSKERDLLYLEGGVVFVTSRILVVDMLKKVCPIDKVAGILVYNGHRVSDMSSESFILRLYRESNKNGFIKAFSDSPESFMKGFCQLEKIMKNLYIRNAYLWPRFHAVVNASLQRHKPDVVELRQQMTPNMTAVQLSILDIMKVCLLDLKRANSMLDIEEVTVENCLGKSFDNMVKLYLDPIWHELSYQSKSLVSDLKMLRTLLFYLTQYDCVTFYCYLEYLKSSGTTKAFVDKSSWIFLEATSILFVKSKERVYGIQKDNKKGSNTDGSSSSNHILEENPKWHLLSMVIEEIYQDYKTRTTANKDGEASGQNEENKETNNGKNQEDKEAEADEQSQTEGKDGETSEQNNNSIDGEISGQSQEDETNEKNGDITGQSKEGEMTEPQEKVLIVTNDYRTSYQVTQYLQSGGRSYLHNQFRKLLLNKTNPEDLSKEFQALVQSKKSSRGRPPLKKKRKLDPEPAAASSGISEGEEHELDFDTAFGDLIEQDMPLEILPNNFSVLPKPVILVYSLSSSSDPHQMCQVLHEKRPRTIIMYDADVRLVRQIEVFKASNPGKPLRVYYLVYDNSVEEQKYLTSLRKENEAFQNLIHQKAHMVVPADREGRIHDNQPARPIESATSSSSRKAGGQKQDNGPQTVIVDMREFRSSLPSLLHKRGMKVLPMTLEVGDYILTPDHCIERKSISDLIGSLNSGRLYNQVSAMTRYYKRPILLIEFEEGRPFTLQSVTSGSGSQVSTGSISSKLTLLTIHFPKLRILWCSSAHVTAELFEKIKCNYPQPDPDSTGIIGSDEGADINDTVDLYNPAIKDCLLKLPGINTRNYRYIMDKVKDFQELVSLSESELSTLLSNDSNAKLLWNGLHGELEQQPPPTARGNNSKSGKAKTSK